MSPLDRVEVRNSEWGSSMVRDATKDNVGKLAAAAFASIERAEAAVQALVDNGFTEDQISVIGSTEEEHLLHEWLPQAQDASGEASPDHFVAGGVLGALLGGAAAVAISGVGWAAGAGIIAASIAGGSFGGGLVGPLLDLDVEEDRAIYLDERLRSGDIIITVHDDDRPGEAQEILEQYGGKTAGTSAR